MNRLELSNAILAWLHRAALRTPVPAFDAVPTFIQLAEQEINLDFRTRAMIRRAAQVADGQYVPLPCDYLEAEDVRLATGRELTWRPRAEMGNLRQVQTGGGPEPVVVVPGIIALPGGPLYYDVIGDLMELWPYEPPPDPPPDAYLPYTIELAYYAGQALGPADTDTTPVLTQLPGAYLYGALLQAAPFVRDDQRVKQWADAYASIKGRANNASERAKSAGSRLVQRFRRVG
jgi:hypothetical protein